MPRGYCKYCGIADAEVYEQDAGVHNDECKECFALYTAIRKYPSRRGGNCREALRRAVRILAQASTLTEVTASLDDTSLTLAERDGIRLIRVRLEAHPSRDKGCIDAAIEAIVSSI